MDYISLEEILSSGGIFTSPGAQLYLYRLLQILALRESSGESPLALSYEGAKKLSRRLGIDSPEKLTSLFSDLGLGSLDFHIDEANIKVLLTPQNLPFTSIERGRIKEKSGCELERGMVDGMLEAYTGLPVSTMETSCWTRGDRVCNFEARRDVREGIDAYRPATASTRSEITRGTGLIKPDSSGILLRSWSLDAISREIARSERHGRPLSLLYVDLDDLGEINVNLGKDAGDQVIKAVASALSRCCRVEDYVWYHGEDEFVIALAETDTSSAEIVARRLNTEIPTAAEYIDIAASISASIGYSTFPTHAGDLSSLLATARSALYLAKSLGKGRAQAARQKVKDEVKPYPHEETEKDEEQAGTFEVQKPQAGQSETEEEPTESEPSIEDLGRAREKAKEELETVPAEISEVVTEESLKEEQSARISEEIETIEVVIASVSPLLLAGMQHVLSDAEDISLVGTVNRPDRLPDAVADIRPDVIFADIQMAAANRFAVLKNIKENNLPCKFAVFVAVVDQDVLRAAADFDADGVILQNSKPSEVLESIREIYKGRKLLPDDVKGAIDELENNRRLLKELSERELEVLRLVAEGKPNSIISKELFITINTVRFHLANIYQKLNVSNRTEAANYYLRQGLDSDGQTKLL